MQRYLSNRHKCLMTESEQALCDVAESRDNHESRIAKQILDDQTIYGLWESRHAELVRPVAEHRKPVSQVFALRDIEVGLVHRQALIDHIRHNKLVGAKCDRLFATFYGPRATANAVLTEHRQYMLAVSSWISSQHLLDVMGDPKSMGLLRMYRSLYARYFAMYCYMVGRGDPACKDATRQMMLDARRSAGNLRRRIQTEKPERGISDVTRQALLARSGRYPVLNYMVG